MKMQMSEGQGESQQKKADCRQVRSVFPWEAGVQVSAADAAYAFCIQESLDKMHKQCWGQRSFFPGKDVIQQLCALGSIGVDDSGSSQPNSSSGCLFLCPPSLSS